MSNDKWDARAKSERDGESDAYIRGHYDGRDLGRDESKSAYAELSAERDALDDRCVMLHGFAEHMRRRAESAESQLAELRGRVSVMLEKWSADSGKHPGTIESIVMKAICAELRTLAAAEGG